MTFERQLATGQIGESIIARWCMSRGAVVVPIYEKEISSGKGPRVYSAERMYVAPDMLILPKDNGSPIWVEAKHKSVFSWHRATDRWCTGIDLHHYLEYMRLEADKGKPVWLLFLHRSETPDDRDMPFCPARCPVGLFGAALTYLMLNENHRSHRHGNHGMVYWSHEHLRLLATLDELGVHR
jgi:hypothetical protein